MTGRARFAGLACVAAWSFLGATESGSASVRHPSWHVAPLRQGGAVASSPGAAVPVAVSARVSEAGGTSRLVFELSAKVAVDAFLIANPARVVVDLPAVDFRPGTTSEPSPRGTGLIRAFRSGLFAPGRSRIVIDLAGPAVLRRASVESIAGGEASRLVVELAKTDWQSFRAAARRQVPAAVAVLPAAAGAHPASPAARPVIVVDPGHGGIDPGAGGPQGVSEKTIVLDFASDLAAKLRAEGRYAVVMTRTDDTFVSLAERVRIARDADAALLISIHADTLQDPAVAGATVYAPADGASDAEAARVADVENLSDEAAGVEASLDAPGVSDILFDLTRRESRTYAHAFQHTLLGYWQKVARVNKNPERSAGFKVLQAPDVPSVLLELGYLSSEKDTASLLSPDWRDHATASVVGAVDAFLSHTRWPAADADAGGRVVAVDKGAPSTDRIVSAATHP